MKRFISIFLCLALFLLPLTACGVNWMGENPVSNEMPAAKIFFADARHDYQEEPPLFKTVSYQDPALPATLTREIGGETYTFEYSSSFVGGLYPERAHWYNAPLEDGKTLSIRIDTDGKIDWGHTIPVLEGMQTEEEYLAYIRGLVADPAHLDTLNLTVTTGIRATGSGFEEKEGFVLPEDNEKLETRTFDFRKESGGLWMERVLFDFDYYSYGTYVTFRVERPDYTEEELRRLTAVPNLEETVLGDLEAYLRECGINGGYTIQRFEYTEKQIVRYGGKLYARFGIEAYYTVPPVYECLSADVVFVDLEDYLE